MNPEEIMKRFTAIAMIITDGDLASLEPICPLCASESLIFSFTVINPIRYGLFIECQNCKYRQHFSLGSKPLNYRDELVLTRFQELEDKIHKLAD